MPGYNDPEGYDAPTNYNVGDNLPASGSYDAGVSFDGEATSYDQGTLPPSGGGGTGGGGGEGPVTPPPVQDDGKFTGILFAPEYTRETLFRIESREKLTGKLVAILPHQNLQLENLLNEQGNMRFDVSRTDPKATRQNFLPGKHEMWLYRADELLFAGPLWNVTGSSTDNVLHLACNGLMSYFNYRLINYSRLFATTSSGGAIAQFMIAQSQAMGGGNLRISYGAYNTEQMGYKVMVLAAERKRIFDQIKELADNEVTGFDFEITPQRVFQAATRLGRELTYPLEYGVNVTGYNLPIYGSTIRNIFTVLGAGEGQSRVIRGAQDTASIQMYGVMEGSEDYPSATNSTQGTQRARFRIAELKNPLATPSLTLEGKNVDFIGTFRPGDSTRVIIDNGYDQYNNVIRLTGYQLSVDTNEKEAVNVYVDAGDETGGAIA